VHNEQYVALHDTRIDEITGVVYLSNTAYTQRLMSTFLVLVWWESAAGSPWSQSQQPFEEAHHSGCDSGARVAPPRALKPGT